MENEVQRAIDIDAHILEASGLVKDKRGYNALLNLLNASVLMTDRLGLENTKEFAKILDKIGLEYRWFDDGIELLHNSHFKYYLKNMYVEPEPYVSKSVFRTYVEGEGWQKTRNSDFLKE